VVTGDIARHGAAMLLASKKFELESQLTSDCEPLCWLIDVLKPFEGYLKWMRDPTRGGVGTILHEFCSQFSLGVRLFQNKYLSCPRLKVYANFLPRTSSPGIRRKNGNRNKP